MDAILNLVDLLIPVVIGLVSKPIFGWIKQAIAVLDRLPDWAQQILVVVQAWGLALIGGWLALQLPENLQLIEIGNVEALLGALFAMLRHLIEKQKQAAR